MQYKTLGSSGCVVSVLGLGTMTFGDTTTEAEALDQLDRFAEVGGTLIDTADTYGFGASESVVGAWLKSRPSDVVDHMVIATKGRFPSGAELDGANSIGNSRRHLSRALDASLKRLGGECIDLYQVHAWDPLTPIAETIGFLDDAVKAGKILYYGLSNFIGWQVQNAVAAATVARRSMPVSLQVQYNLLAREVEWEMAPAAENAGLGLLAWSPLAGGLLTGKYRRQQEQPQQSRVAGTPLAAWYGPRLEQERTWQVLDAVDAVAQRRGVDAAAVALAWLVRRPGMSSVLIGARTTEQLNGNLVAADLVLDEGDITQLDEASLPIVDYPYNERDVMVRSRNPDGGFPRLH